MLEIKDLHVHYGGIHALKGISLAVPEGKSLLSSALTVPARAPPLKPFAD